MPGRPSRVLRVLRCALHPTGRAHACAALSCSALAGGDERHRPGRRRRAGYAAGACAYSEYPAGHRAARDIVPRRDPPRPRGASRETHRAACLAALSSEGTQHTLAVLRVLMQELTVPRVLTVPNVGTTDRDVRQAAPVPHVNEYSQSACALGVSKVSHVSTQKYHTACAAKPPRAHASARLRRAHVPASRHRRRKLQVRRHDRSRRRRSRRRTAQAHRCIPQV